MTEIAQDIEGLVKNGKSNQLMELLKSLSKDQLRFVVAMQEYNSKKEAADALGLKRSTVYNWARTVDEAIKLLQLDILESARQMRKSALLRAMMIKIVGLDSPDEKVRQNVATEIIEGEMGKATQRQEVAGSMRYILDRSKDDDIAEEVNPEAEID